MKHFKFLPALLLLFAPVLASAAVPQGEYVGLITGGGKQSTTTFKTDDGKITATYYMSEVKSGGTISKIKLDGQNLTGEWKDEFGKGYVLFIFNPDYSSFQGCWSKKKIKDCEETSQSWNGNR